jgi:hypothetical protein
MGQAGGANAGRAVKLALSERPTDPAQAAQWIGPLVALGGMSRRFAASLDEGRQLVVAVSVPRRDFAAALIGCGWVIQRPAPTLPPPLETLRGLAPGDGIRIITDEYVITDKFEELIDGSEPRIRLASPNSSQWMASHIRAVSEVPTPRTLKVPHPPVGSLARWAKMEATWNTRLAAASADLAIVGTVKWLREDFGALITTSDDGPPRPVDAVGGLLLPESDAAAAAFTMLYASSRLADQLPLSEDHEAVLLDGAGAIKYLGEIEAPVVICVVDRSVADESAPELIVQLRNTRSEPIAVRDDLGWRAPAGIEAMAFTVAL